MLRWNRIVALLLRAHQSLPCLEVVSLHAFPKAKNSMTTACSDKASRMLSGYDLQTLLTF